MQFGKVLAAATAAASLMTSTAAFAGTATRANTALPQAAATTAPVNGVRKGTDAKKKSNIASTGIIIGVLALAGTAAGVVAAASNDSKADSPG